MYAIYLIAMKNVKMFFKNIILLPMFVFVPLFQIYMMNNMEELEAVPGPIDGYVKITFLGDNLGSALDFTVASLLVQFIFISAVVLSSSMLTERQEKTYLRMLASPMKKWKIVLGNLVGNALVTLFISAFIIIGSYFIYDISWGSTPITLVLFTVLTSFASASILYFLASFFSTSKTAGGALSMIIILMTFLSGGFTGEGTLQTLRLFTFNKYAIDGYLAIIRQQQGQVLLVNALVLITLATVSLIAATIIYERRDLNG